MYYIELASNATKVIKAGPGTLWGVVVTNAGTSWNFQILDATVSSGSLVAGYKAIAGATKVSVPAAGTPLYFNCGFTQGLVIVT